MWRGRHESCDLGVHGSGHEPALRARSCSLMSLALKIRSYPTLGSIRRPRLRLSTALLCWSLVPGICLNAQQSPPTVRHHRVEEPAPDPSSAPEVDQAEA